MGGGRGEGEKRRLGVVETWRTASPGDEERGRLGEEAAGAPE